MRYHDPYMLITLKAAYWFIVSCVGVELGFGLGLMLPILYKHPEIIRGWLF